MNESSGLWPLRLLAMVIALGVWLVFSFIPRWLTGHVPLLERAMDTPVTFSLPEGITVLNPGQTVRVQLRGSQEAMRLLTFNDVAVEVVFANGVLAGTVETRLGPGNVKLPKGIEVVSLTPNRLDIQLDREVTGTLAVLWNRRGELVAGAELRDVVVTPSEVLVSGPESRLARVTHVTTEPINLDGRAISFSVEAQVVSDDVQIRIQRPRVVRVDFTIEPPPGPTAVPEGNT